MREDGCLDQSVEGGVNRISLKEVQEVKLIRFDDGLVKSDRLEEIC